MFYSSYATVTRKNVFYSTAPSSSILRGMVFKINKTNFSSLGSYLQELLDVDDIATEVQTHDTNSVLEFSETDSGPIRFEIRI